MKEFLTTDIGLMSLAVVATTIVIIGYLARMFMTRSRED
ncbi:MAG: DUF3149 domain-containing protein [Gammaproteobacteria bacterium]